MVPGFVDSHAHLVFAGDRAAEFEARMSGARYDGGGIAHHRRPPPAPRPTRSCGPGCARLLAEMRAPGHDDRRGQERLRARPSSDEARCLRLAAEVTPETTFLGAHVVPPSTPAAPDEYVALVTGPMLAACAPHARWIDVFCEPASAHAFDGDQARAVLEAGPGRGPGPAGARQPALGRPGRAARPSSSAPRAPTTAPT